MSTPHILFLTIPICPKCKVMRKRLDQIQQSHPEVVVDEDSVLNNLGLARKHGILNMPAVIINEKSFTGIVDVEVIKQELGL